MQFLKLFLLLWVIFALLDPDPNSEYEFGSTDSIESGSNWDPDTQPCLKGRPSYRRSLQPSKENIHHLPYKIRI